MNTLTYLSVFSGKTSSFYRLHSSMLVLGDWIKEIYILIVSSIG